MGMTPFGSQSLGNSFFQAAFNFGQQRGRQISQLRPPITGAIMTQQNHH